MGSNKALIDKGFIRPTYDDLLRGQIESAKTLFGADIDTGELTPLGKFMRLNVIDMAKAYEAIELAYYSRFPNTAIGQSLDRLLPFAGISRNPATAARHIVTMTGTPNFVVEAGFLVSTQSGVTFYLFDEAIINDDGVADAVFECTKRGQIGNVELGEITDIVNPSADVLEISHKSVDFFGEKAESDHAVRKRFMSTISGSGSATYDAIVGAIMRIRGVRGVLIDENDTDDTNANGVPRRSFETFVLAPKELIQNIADTIFSKKPLGIKTHGENEVAVADKGGFSHTIKFSWTTEIFLQFKIKVRVNSLFESDGEQQIKDNITQYLSYIVNGQTVVLTSLYGYIYSVTGVAYVVELLMSSDGGKTFTSDDVKCKLNEVPVVFPQNVFVEVVRNDL